MYGVTTSPSVESLYSDLKILQLWILNSSLGLSDKIIKWSKANFKDWYCLCLGSVVTMAESIKNDYQKESFENLASVYLG